MRISDWSSDVCSSDLCGALHRKRPGIGGAPAIGAVLHSITDEEAIGGAGRGRSDGSVTSGKTIGFIIATIFIDAIGFGIIMPVLPQLVMELGRLDLPHAIEVGADRKSTRLNSSH